jgi:4-amino-4-deoxy-L-arabinose transferase-like glycosyltransferase
MISASQLVASWPMSSSLGLDESEKTAASEQGARHRPRGHRAGSWPLSMLLITVLALAVRLGYAFIYRRQAQPTGDAYYYHYQANLLASGKGFINPDTYYFVGRTVAAADHPPLWTLVLALAALTGLKSFFSQILWSCVIGALSVAIVGFAAREVAGQRVGLVAAVIAALYPTFWIDDGALMSETLVVTTTAAIIWLFYRLWHGPSIGRAILLGVACALAALTRSELVVLIPILAVGMVLGGLAPGVQRRLALSAALVLGALVTFAPWWIYNIPRFSNPVLLSSQLGVTLQGANCPATYSGPLIGSWSLACNLAVKVKPGTDPSQQDEQFRSAAFRYAEHHESRLPEVALARVGRELGLFRPFEQIDLEWSLLGRPRLPATVGLFAFYTMAITGVAGAVVLRWRRIRLWPLVGIGAVVIVTAVATFGETRYRTSLDVALVVLAAVMVDEGVQLLGQGRRPARRKRSSDDSPEHRSDVIGSQAISRPRTESDIGRASAACL